MKLELRGVPETQRDRMVSRSLQMHQCTIGTPPTPWVGTEVDRVRVLYRHGRCSRGSDEHNSAAGIARRCTLFPFLTTERQMLAE